MCLNSKKIITKSNKIYIDTQAKIFNYVKCGKCSECQQDHKTEWMYRTYYQTIDTIEKGGYIIFDTLTYNENTCPWSKDVVKREFNIDIPEDLNFRCFDYRDVQLFFKRFRKKLSRFNGTKKVKYFLSGEYGTTEGKTHRPHYHVIFYVLDSLISPELLSETIKECWQNGMCDGIPDKGKGYFYQNRLFKSSKGVTNAVGYVAKYINKDSYYQKIVDLKIGQIEKLFDNFDEKYYKYTYAGKLRKMNLRRKLSQFHKNSHGYGELALERINIDNLWQTGKVEFPDSYIVKRKLTLPMYYYRKMFQKYDKLEKKWKYTNLGLEYKKKQIVRSIDTLAQVYQNRLDTNKLCPNYGQRKKNITEDEKQNIVNEIYTLLGNRTIKDYAEYKILFQDRMINTGNLLYGLNLYLVKFNNEGEYIKMYVTQKNIEENGLIKCVMYNDEIIPYGTFIRCNVVNDNTHEKFMNYDKIDVLMRKLSIDDNERMQAKYEYMQDLRKKFKKNEKKCIAY